MSILKIQRATPTQLKRMEVHGVLDWLSGQALEKMANIPANAPLPMNVVQRGVAWGDDQAEGLASTLFDAMVVYPAEFERLRGRVDRNQPLYEDCPVLQPYFQDLSVQPRSADGADPGSVSVLDGQQRSFSLSCVAAWLLVRSAPLANPGELPPEALWDALTIPSTKGPRMPRLDFNQTESITWPHHGRAQGPLGHFLFPLSDRGVSWKVAGAAMDNMLDRDLASAAGQSVQARLIRSVFQAMDRKLAMLEEENPTAKRGEILSVMASSFAQSSIGVGVLHPDVDSTLYFGNANGSGKQLTQTDHVRPVLISAAGGSESKAGILVGEATHAAEALATRAVGVKSKNRVLGAAYAAALDAVVGNYGAGGALQSGEGAPLACLRMAMGEVSRKNPAKRTAHETALATRMATHLSGAVEACALLTDVEASRKIDAHDALIKDPELVSLMQAHAGTKLRALTSVVATMALIQPEQAKRVLRMVNHTYAENRLVGEALSIALDQPRQERWQTQRLDHAVKTWSKIQPKNKKALAQAPLALLELIANGSKSSGYVQTDPKDMLLLVDSLADPKAAKRLLDSDVMSGKPGARCPGKELSHALAIALDLSNAELAAGVRLVAGGVDMGVLQGAMSKGRTVPAKTLDLSSSAIRKRLAAQRRKVWADLADVDFSAKQFVPITEEWRLAARLEERAGDIQRMLKSLGDTAETTIEQYKSNFTQLAKVMDTRAWNQVVLDIPLAHRLYKAKFHEMDEAGRREAWKTLRKGSSVSVRANKHSSTKPRRGR